MTYQTISVCVYFQILKIYHAQLLVPDSRWLNIFIGRQETGMKEHGISSQEASQTSGQFFNLCEPQHRNLQNKNNDHLFGFTLSGLLWWQVK